MGFQLPSLSWVGSYFEGSSQTTACNATGLGECLFSTALDRLWYIYSYIYHQISSNATTIIFLLFFALAILMSTTNSSTPTSSLVSPSPHISRTRPFTMAVYTSVTAFDFSFGDHPLCPQFSSSLNAYYAEPFQQSLIDSLFTDNTRATVSPNVIPSIRAAIIDTIMITSTADRSVVAPIINSMFLFAYAGHPARKFPLRSSQTVTTALQATVAVTHTCFMIQLNTASVYVNPDAFTVLDFVGLSTTPIRNTCVGANAAAAAAAATAASAATAATNANQFVVQQAAAAVTAAATAAAIIPTTFDHRNLPSTVKQRHLSHLDPDYLMTQNDMSPFPISSGGVCESFNHLDPPLGSGVTALLDSHRIIARHTCC